MLGQFRRRNRNQNRISIGLYRKCDDFISVLKCIAAGSLANNTNNTLPMDLCFSHANGYVVLLSDADEQPYFRSYKKFYRSIFRPGDVEMKPTPAPAAASASLGTSDSTVADQPPTWYRLASERTQRSQEAGAVPLSGVITYRGIRGLKHRNDRLHRSTTTVSAVIDRQPGQPASDRQPPRQSTVEQCPSSSDQPRPVQATSSRRSASADRLKASTSTPRTFFESLYNDRVE